ncbi:isochorismatase family protein [Actinoplanes sp. NPDC051494]|uniref:isochorismatase family protein n=1 Tax=Actinoplanes sp. NPDC051494 TaxID=3363907 RepID=UPI0037A11E06
MSTLANRPNAALLVIDVQNGVVQQAHDRDAIVGTIATLVGKARTAGTDVIWVQHSSDELPRDSDTWQFAPELAPRAGEALIHKRYGDSFEDTELEQVLAERGVGSLFVSGAQTDACIRSTLHGAIARGYDATLVADAHTTEDLSAYGAPPPGQVIAHTNLYWHHHDAPGRNATTVTTADVDFTRHGA